MAWVAFTTAKDITHIIAGVVFRHKVNERVVIQMREGETLLRRTIIICIVFEDTVYIVITTIVSTEDRIDTPLDVLHIGAGSFQLLIEDRSCRYRVMVSVTPNGSTEVVTAIDIITNPGESAVISYMYLRTTIDVSIGSTSEGIIDTTIAQIDV